MGDAPDRLREAERLELLERADPLAWLRNSLRRAAREKGEWAGLPMPLADAPLRMDPKFPNAEKIEAFSKPEPEDDEPSGEEYADAKIRNEWHCAQRRCRVIIFEHKGKIDWGIEPEVHHGGELLRTLGAADAWGIEQERKAIELLATLVPHRQFKQYMITGMFLTSSKRSGLFYVFRRLRPTLVLSPHGKSMRILAGLCLHPIGYYDRSWAGAMAPTDEVIAHFLLMRGDEHLFWRRANQHPPSSPLAGI